MTKPQRMPPAKTIASPTPRVVSVPTPKRRLQIKEQAKFTSTYQDASAQDRRSCLLNGRQLLRYVVPHVLNAPVAQVPFPASFISQRS